MDRKSGVLLHITSLPSKYGIGDFGPGAYDFIDFLKKSKQSLWQVLPLNPTDFINGNSPYSSPSAFAGNTLFISPDVLVKKGYIKKSDVGAYKDVNPSRVDYKKAAEFKSELLASVFHKNKEDLDKNKEFNRFCEENSYWLDDYAMFVYIKQVNDLKMWLEWPKALRDREEKDLQKIQGNNGEEILKVKFLQYLFYEQWEDLKKYANSAGIKIIGDIPIYVNLDSSDVWSHSELFKLDENKKPFVVAGVPPDYFSETGQRWGNPVYDWNVVKENNFSWWMDRLRRNLDQFDIIRIDHFRGLVNYWEIPADEETAVNGSWQAVPTDDFFNAIREKFPGMPIIAEDLGMITDDVKDVIQKLGFPGMKILMFAFGGNLHENPYIPGNFENNSVIYTGTHDNNTVHGWFRQDASNDEKSNMITFLGREVSLTNLHWEFIDMAFGSDADFAIIPLQDFLGLDESARMNTPGTVGNNWEWRNDKKALSSKLSKEIANLTKKTGRI